MARVLVVDDDPDILSLVQLQLRQAGHATFGASSGPEALAAVEADGAPDVAILDVRMPGMNGFELLSELRTRGFTDLRVIFLSARAQHEDITNGDTVADAYLTKPYESSELLSEIERVLRKR